MAWNRYLLRVEILALFRSLMPLQFDGARFDEHCAERVESGRRRQREACAKKKTFGRCRDCGEKARAGRLHCAACAEKNRVRNKANYDRRKAAGIKRGAPFCNR